MITSTVNSELQGELARYESAPVVVAAIHAALGARSGEQLSVEAFPVVAFLLLPSEELLRSFFVTPRRLVIFEMLGDGTSLTVTTPLSRLSRIVEQRSAEAVLVTLELDADVVRSVSTGQTFTAPVVDEQGVLTGQVRGETASVTENRPAVYEISAVVGTEADFALSEFARRVRAALEH